MKCFYHNDMDGKCAGAIVRKAYRQQGEYIPIDYKDDFPFDTISQNETVVIVDFSLQKEGDFERLLTITKNVVWIDHHKSAIEKHAHISDQVKGIQEVNKIAGCGLTWKYLFPEQHTPRAVQLLGDYDTWTFAYGEDSKLFQIGCQLEETQPESDIWIDWLDRVYDPYSEIQQGRMLKQYQDKANAATVKHWAFFAEFEGYRAVCCNSHVRNSQLFDSITEPYDLMMPFIWDGKQWTVSIYTTREDTDCSELAKKYGGGGHKGAAGFQCQVLPFKL